jgi:hypothetical protein
LGIWHSENVLGGIPSCNADDLRDHGFIFKSQTPHRGGALPEEEAMLNLLKEIIKSGEISVSYKQVSAKGGLAITLTFILIMVVLFKVG